MIDLPTTELLRLWADLVEAYHGVNWYGGHTAEIYFYRLARYDPSALNADASWRSTVTGGEAHREWKEAAYANLFEVLSMFAKQYRAEIVVDEGLVASGDFAAAEAWRTRPRDNTHRWHVKVWPTSENEPEGR